MGEDGACLFRAIGVQAGTAAAVTPMTAFHVYGDQEMHDVVRQNCMDYIDKNRDHFAPFITEDFGEYVRRKRNPRCHGNHTEIQALSELYGRNVEVYSYAARSPHTPLSPAQPCAEPINTFLATGSTEAPIRVSYHSNIHYNAIIDPNLPTFGVGLGFSDLRPGVCACIAGLR